MRDKTIVLDGDGVVFDYRQAYPAVWKKAFGTEIKMVEPNAYHAHTAHGVKFETPAQETRFFAFFDEEAWATMPLMEGAAEACALLVDCGYRLVIVSSMNPKFAGARLRNCELHNLPISEVFAVRRVGIGNPKLPILHELQPVALVDDLKDNFEGLQPSIHSAFINYGRFDCPSIGHEVIPDSEHRSLLDFARFWTYPK
jgi:hypothetical protein